MIPATLISEESVVKAVSWLCADKCSGITKVEILDQIVSKYDLWTLGASCNLSAGDWTQGLVHASALVCATCCIYSPKKDNVKPFHARKLLKLQAKMGTQPHLQALLSWCVFAPALISVSAQKEEVLESKPRASSFLAALSGSVLNNSLLLHYTNYVRDESLSLSLYHWLSQNFQEGSCCAIQADLELTMWPRLALNLQQFSCLSLLNSGITDIINETKE
ncbi:centromere protein I isoform X2 [Cavia porcellus]|uniref:centromere protein I isoform X2 n=1 Tax=Cavia porcellus TaxID=10141 RepID=UPI002FDF1C6A